MLAAGAGRVGYIFHLFSLSNILSFGRRLNKTEILWFRLLNPNGILDFEKAFDNPLMNSLKANCLAMESVARH